MEGGVSPDARKEQDEIIRRWFHQHIVSAQRRQLAYDNGGAQGEKDLAEAHSRAAAALQRELDA
jgi:hypothetical protein